MYSKRTPTGAVECFAWGFIVGYMGEVPDEMKDMDEGWAYDPSTIPSFLSGMDAREYRMGYDSGCVTFADHATPEE